MTKPVFTTPEPLVSVIVRTKNEERWIGSCLRAIFRQNYRNFEVILVDNMSTDQTVAKAKQFNITLVEIEKFLPGKALNDGIRASRGEILVCLSGHCIPVNEDWLGALVRDLSDPDVAGVYGRQEPLSFSSDLDKRDLMITFGLDRKVQRRDTFFHNANSALRRETWDRFPFDETVTNIEDRLWAKHVLAAGHSLVYEPEASVYHWHGIHHDLNPERARNVVRIMESISGQQRANGHTLEDLHIVAIVPSRGEPKMCGDRPLIEATLREAQKSPYIREVIVATDSSATAQLVTELGASAPFLRPAALSEDYVDVVDVLQFALDRIESAGIVPDLVVVLEETQPFRPAGMIDAMIERLVNEGLDSVVAAKPEGRRLWLRKGDETRDLTEDGFMPRQFKESVAYIGMVGLGCVTHPSFIRLGSMLGSRFALYEVTDSLAAIEVRDQDSVQRIRPLLESWLQEQSE